MRAGFKRSVRVAINDQDLDFKPSLAVASKYPDYPPLNARASRLLMAMPQQEEI